MSNSTTLEDALCDRFARSSSFFEVYCAAFNDGAGLPDDREHSETMRQLLWLLRDRHRLEVPPKLADDIPGWLLSLAQQADTIERDGVEGWPT
jgi:hypothetical protein